MAKKTFPCPGKFRDYITLQTKTSVKDGAGGSVDTWSDEASFWAKMTPLSANQRLYAKQLEGVAAFKMVTRYRSDITVSIDKRISWRGRVFQVQSPPIDIDERQRFIEVMLAEGEAT